MKGEVKGKKFSRDFLNNKAPLSRVILFSSSEKHLQKVAIFSKTSEFSKIAKNIYNAFC